MRSTMLRRQLHAIKRRERLARRSNGTEKRRTQKHLKGGHIALVVHPSEQEPCAQLDQHQESVDPRLGREAVRIGVRQLAQLQASMHAESAREKDAPQSLGPKVR